MGEKPHKIRDAGEKIGGARKDWDLRPMGIEDLDGATPEEALDLARKETVWPRPDYSALILGGVEPLAAALVRLIRNRLAAKPNMATRQIESGELRQARRILEDYVRMMSIVRDTMMACRTVEDVRGALNHILDGSLHWSSRWSDPETRHLLLSVRVGRRNPLAVGTRELAAASNMLEEGFPGPSGGKVLGPKASRPAKLPVRHRLDVLRRVGLRDHREGRNVSPEDFISTFRFRGIEFGNWLPDGERQQVLNLAYDSLFDLTDALGWTHTAVSLHGTLAVAFGARGHGHAIAHYESGRRVINITRLSGAGALAHEFAHALDHWTGDVGSTEPGRGEVRSASGWRQLDCAHARRLRNLAPEESGAWARIMDALFLRTDSESGTADRIGMEIDAAESEKIRARERLSELSLVGAHVDERTEQVLRARIQEQETLLTNLRRRHRDAVRSLERESPSEYFRQATKIANRRGYWTRPNEMFARAFEATVFDLLVARHCTNDYLVHSVEADRYASPTYRGNPYPAGEERTRIVGRLVDMVAVFATTRFRRE